MKVTVVIPAYNEATTIRPLAEAILDHGLELIVVDDGSSDDTAAQLEGLSLQLIQHQENRGKAASLRRGMDAALGGGADGVLTMDGDGQHRPEEIQAMLNCFTDNPECLVIGARLRNREQAPAARLFANNFADFWISWAAGRRISDSQSGFRLYPAQALRHVRIGYNKYRGFVYESEFLIEAARQCFCFKTVAIASHYPQQTRASHFRPVVDISRIVLMVAWKLIKRGLYLQGLVRSLRKAN
jgi:glycosyltransferase involved in cell wall biosynthesis